MIIGCLTGNDKRPPIEGAYSYCAAGLLDPLAPDLQADHVPGTRADRAPGSGPFAFAQGALTTGEHTNGEHTNGEHTNGEHTAAVLTAGVGWRAATVGETGVDVVFRLGTCCFVDHVVLHLPASGPDAPQDAPVAPPAPDGIEAAGHVEPDGLSRVEVYATARQGGDLCLVGWVGQRGPDVLQGRVSIGVGVEAVELVVRLISYHHDIRLSEIELWGAGSGEPVVFPLPAQMERLPGAPLVLAADVTIRIGALACDDVRFAAAMLAQELRERWGWTVPVVREEGLDGLHLAPSGASGPLIATGLPVPDRPEGYALCVEAQGALLLAADRRGCVYGVHTLLQLLAASHPAPGLLAPCLIEDAPRLPFRGVHLFLPARDQIDYTKRLIRHLLVPMRLNTLFLELAGGMRYKRRPEISETWERNNRLAAEGQAPPVPHGEVGGGWLTQAEVVDLVDYARCYGIEVIPEIQSLSHVQYLTMTYPHVAEQPLEVGYPDSYCTQPFADRVVAHPWVSVRTLTPENREDLPGQILPELAAQGLPGAGPGLQGRA